MGIHKINLLTLLVTSNIAFLGISSAEVATNNTSSRHLLNDKDATARLLGKLAMKERMIDPFGKHQDPNFKEAPKLPNQPIASTPTEKIEVLLENEIGKLRDKINGIGNGSFMIGSNFYKRGSSLDVAVADKTFQIQVIRITPQKIVFLNTNNQKMIDLDMTKKNTGIQSGASDIKLPSDQGPIILDK